jgi:hypothetical protein
MVAHLLPSLSFVSRKKKKKGDGSKLVIIALFVLTIKKIKCNGNKLVVVAHFLFKHEKKGQLQQICCCCPVRINNNIRK